MSSVSRTESIVYKEVAERSKFLGESLAVFGFFCAVTGVLKKNNVAILHFGNSLLCIFADNAIVSGKNNVQAEFFGKTCRNGSQREFGLGLTLGLAEVRAKNNLCALGKKVLNGRKRGNYTVFVGNYAFLKGNVEVATNKNTLAGNLKIFNRLFCVHFCFS